MTEAHHAKGRISCQGIGCIVAAVLFLALAGWIGSGFIFWKRARIPLPDGSGSIVYMAKLNKIPFAEWDRQVRFETRRFRGRTRWVTSDPGGGFPINVYWYQAKDGTGPYLKLDDPICECFVDLKHGTTLLVWPDKGGGYAAEMSSPRPKIGWRDDPKTGDVVDTFDGHPVRKLEKWVFHSHGQYLGRIEYPYNRFVSAKRSPEQKLPQH